MSYPRAEYPGQLLELMPCIPRKGPARGYVVELFRPLGDLDLLGSGLYDALVDIEAAQDWMLDYRASLVGEPRAGLSDLELRRITTAREIAFVGAITAPRVWAAWSAVCGTTDGTIETRAPGDAMLTAQLDFIPSEAYIQRARAVMRDCVAVGVEVTGYAALPGGARWGDPLLGWGVGTWGVRLA